MRRILIVEDEIAIADNLKAWLEELGYAVAGIVFSGEEAIQQAAETLPDLVLMDIVLRGKMDGLQAAQEIRTCFDIPVVYLTGYADELTLQRAKITEPFGFILKPFEVRELHSTIDMALYKHALERKLRESEKKYRSVVEHSLQGILIIQDVPPRVVFANSPCAEITGYSLEELLAMPPEETLLLVHPDERPVLLDRLRAHLAGKPVPATDRFRVIRKDGSWRWVEYFASLIEHEGRSALQSAFVDITERKLAEEALQKAHLELEGRVEERTAELSRVNALLQAEIATRWEIEDALHQRLLELGVLNTLGQQVSASLSLDQVVKAALKGIVDSVAPDLALLFLRQGDELPLRGIYPEQLEWQQRAPDIHRLGQCLCGLAAAEGRPVYCRDIHTDPRCTLKECKSAGMRSFAALPLLKGREVLGVLGLASTMARDLGERADFLEALTGHIAIGLQNALLHEEVRCHAAALEQEVIERKQAEEALRKSEERFRSLFDNAPLCIFEVDFAQLPPNIVRANCQVERLYGWTSKALASTPLVEIFPSERRPDLERIESALRAGEVISLESIHQKRDGSTFPVRISAAPESTADPDRAILAVEDITAEKARRSEEEAIAEERRRIAREIHDGLAQDLASLRFKARLWHDLIDQSPAQMHAEVDDLREFLGEKIRDVRRSIFALRPIALDELGFHPALHQFANDFGEQHQVHMDLRIRGPKDRLPPPLEPALFRIVQEALNNVGKHARATAVLIELDLEAADSVALRVWDDGVGFDPAILDEAVRHGHLGLKQMRERVEELHGTFSLQARPGEGTEIQATLPLAGLQGG